MREKEKGDWHKLTIEEKKALYRASFCQTFAEMKAPTGEWKSVLGFALVGVSVACWIYIWMKKYGEFFFAQKFEKLVLIVFCALSVYAALPVTMTPERQQAQLERMINMQINPVEGLASKYDYEKGRWKE